VKLLIVEDNEELAQNLQEVFEDAGHHVTVVPSGMAALTAAESGFDLALVDLRLPDGSGTALLPRLKRLMPDAEVVVTTGNADLESAIEAVQAGAFAYLVKPVGMQELQFTVSRALERVELRARTRALQEELRRSEQRHRDIVETVQVLVFSVDDHDVVQFCNTAVEEVTGWPRELLMGRRFSETLLGMGEREDHRHALELALTGAAPQRETALLARDGRTLHIQMRWTRSGGAVGGLVYGTGLDVTKQRELERAARVTEKLAAVGTLTAGLAHEIRNPLNAALLQLSVAERRLRKTAGGTDVTAHQPLALVRAELSRLSLLVEDFLAFARPREAGAMPVDVCAIIRELIAMEAPLAESKGRILHAGPLAENLSVRGDFATLKGAMLNLIRNAIQACTTDVTVRAVAEGGQAVITIADDGPGIPAEVQAHLFEPFFTTKDGGTGLGLAIVHATITAHGGEIALTGGTEGGTVARVVLPALTDRARAR